MTTACANFVQNILSGTALMLALKCHALKKINTSKTIDALINVLKAPFCNKNLIGAYQAAKNTTNNKSKLKVKMRNALMDRSVKTNSTAKNLKINV